MRNMLQFVARLLCVAAFLCLGSGGVWAQADVWNGKAIADKFAGGTGTSDKDPYQIATAAQLAYLADQVNNGNSYDGKHFKLTNDIDLNNHDWIVIGGSFSSHFKGSFDGKGYTISNLGTKEMSHYDSPIGLFGAVEGATIENLTVIISETGLNKGSFAGGIAGSVQGNATTTIKNCCVLGGPINAYHDMDKAAAGGIVGAANSTEENFALTISFCCVNVSNITSTVLSGQSCVVGGIVGFNPHDRKVTIQNCASFTTNMKCSNTFSDNCEFGGILGKGSTTTTTLSDNYSNPLCLFTKAIIDYNLQEQSSTITKITGGASNNANGAALTTENSKPNGAAFNGWAGEGWTLAEDKLPKISDTAPDITVKISIGAGTTQAPYLITSVADLEYVTILINNGVAGFNGTEYYRLENDIDLESKELTPIGTPGNPSKGIKGNPFKGTFDGNTHTIKNLRVKNDKVDTTPIGLFGCIESATIKNLGVVISDQGIRDLSSSCETIGGIVGQASGGTITSCFVTGGSITAYKPGNQGYAGGIIGYAEGNVTVSYCYTAVESIFGYVDSGGSGAAGGIIGAFNGNNITIKNCLSLTPLYRSGGESGYYKCGRIIAYGINYSSPTLTNNFYTPLYLVVGGSENENKGTDLTKENFNEKSGNALDGWTAQRWTLHEGRLPTLDPDATGLPIDQFLISGNGTSTAPYQVRNEKDLLFFATQINQGASSYNGTEYYQLVKDLTLSSSDWTPIGTSTYPFKGTFDGNNKTITLGIKAEANQAQAGLFGTIDTDAKVEKLVVHVTSDGITSTATGAASNAGAIAAINNGTINQCYVTGDGFILSANGTNSYAGGIAGSNGGTISNCYNLIPVKVDNGTTAYAGGIAGHNTGTVKKCFASGEVSTAEKTHAEAAGGIVGFNDGASSTVVSNCVAVNSKVAVNAGTNAHRVIGTGGNDNDVNNFSHHEMSLVTKAADTYDPLEGTALTKENANSATGGCFNGWEAAWDLDAIGTYMPKLQGFADQKDISIASYLLYTVTINSVSNGTLTVTRPNPLNTGGSPITVNNGDQVPFNTVLSITATPSDNTYELKALTVNSSNFTSGNIHTVTDNVTVSATFKKIEYTVNVTKTGEGELLITYPNPNIPGKSHTVNNEDKVAVNTELTITATPASGYKLKMLTVNGGNFASGSTHTVADNVTVEATFEAESVDPGPIDPDPTPTPPQPTVYYTVTLPSVEGVATDPVAGEHEVESWSNFRFSLTLDSAYNQSVPVVTTDRGETLKPRQSDGAYILNQVRSDVEIYISGIVKNPDPVANEAIKATAAKVWITNNHLHLQSPVDADAYIYTAAGNQQAICHLTAGQQETIQLPAGIYFIRIGNERFKVRL